MPQLLVLPAPSMPIQNYTYRSVIPDRKLTNSTSMITTSSSRTNGKKENEELQIDFEPGQFDVICSQGKTSKTHAGNVYFQSVIHKRAKEYANTIEKRIKSKIVRNIIETIKTKSANGGFVKKNSDGQWEVVTLEQAREKVSQSLRDALAGRYRSSLSAKKRSRMESNLKRMIDFDEMIGTNKFVTERMHELSKTIKTSNPSSNTNGLFDSNILKKMTETNFCILRQLKKDRLVQQTVRVGHSQQQVEDHNERKISSSTSAVSAIDETLHKFQTDRDFMM